MNMRHVGFLIAACCLSFAGCESVPEHQKGTVPVKGIVTLGGAPVAGATVTFLAGKDGRSASAITDAQGHYALTTFRRGDGALPDDYNVIVMKFEVVTGGQTGKKYVPVQETSEPKNQLPARYAQPGKSGLKATVTVDAKTNVFDFSLSP
jgi:hypothetical protein